MKLFKKLLTVVLCLVMGLGCCAALTACDGGGGGFTLWGSADDKAMLEEMVADFTAKNAELVGDLKITVGTVEESDAKTKVLENISKAGDVFAFVDDQLAELVENSALYDLTLAEGTTATMAAMSAGSVLASTDGSKIYAYPSSSESFFMYYDKDVYTENDVKTLEGMIAKRNSTNVLGIAAKDGFYANMFFAAAGCSLYGVDGRDADDCTWNNVAGKKAADYLTTLKTKGIMPYDVYATMLSKFTDKTVGAVITGSWEHKAFKAVYGDKLGIAVLPKFTFTGDATQSQLTPFRGYKMYGVNSTTKNSAVAIKLAQYLTAKEAQVTRFNSRAFTPVNTSLASDASVIANALVKIDLESAKIAAPKPGHKTAGKYWEPAGNLSYNLMDGKIAAGDIQAALDKFVNDITK